MTDKDMALRVFRKTVRLANRGVTFTLSDDRGGHNLTVSWSFNGKIKNKMEDLENHTHIPDVSGSTERDLLDSLDGLLSKLLAKSGDPDYIRTT